MKLFSFSILAMGLITSHSMLAAQPEQSTSKTKIPSVNQLPTSEVLETPTFLSTTRFLGGNYLLLAPQKGTDVALGLGQSQIKLSRSDSNGRSSGTSNSTAGILSVSSDRKSVV